MGIDSDEILQAVPYYLPVERKKGLVRELANLSPQSQLFSEWSPFPLLQGDVWKGLPIFDFSSQSSRRIKGVILSNSCDISEDNDRHLPVKVSFAPLVALAVYKSLLLDNGMDVGRVENHINDLKNQAITSLMYLPANPSLGEEHLVLLSDVYSVPLQELADGQPASRVTSFNNTGFYLLLFKLMVHFCRMHEGVDREAENGTLQ